MGLAVEIFLLKGIAQSGAGNEPAALREFRSMYELNPTLARQATKNIYDARLIGLLRRAEGREPEPETKAQAAEKPALAAAADGRAAQPASSLVLAISSEPPGAQIFIDGADTGKTTDAEITGLSLAPHTIKLVKELFADWTGPVPDLGAGGKSIVAAKLYAASYASSGIWGGVQSDMFSGPTAVTVSKEGLIFVADSGPVRIRIVNSDGESQAFGRGPELDGVVRPGGLAVDGQGAVYVSDPESHTVLKFDRSGRFLTSWGAFGAGTAGFNTPLGLAVDGKGDILVADGGNGLIKRFGPDGSLAGSFGQEGPDASRLVFPRGVAVTSRGEVAVLDQAQVVLYAADGKRLAAWGTAGSGDGEFVEPFGIAVDSLDCVYVADSGNHRIQKFDPRGRFLCAWGGQGAEPMMLNDPSGIAVDARGAVYVIEKINRRVQVFTVGSGALGLSEQ